MKEERDGDSRKCEARPRAWMAPRRHGGERGGDRDCQRLQGTPVEVFALAGGGDGMAEDDMEEARPWARPRICGCEVEEEGKIIIRVRI